MSLNRIIGIISIVLLIVIVFVGYQFSGRLTKQFAPAAPQTKVTINDATFSVEVATSSAQRQKGLSGRASIPKDQGMLFIFEEPDYHSFWMKDMQFPIDMLFIHDNKVVSLKENVQPPASETEIMQIVTPETPITMVLEINAGLSQTHKIKPGDSVQIEFKQ